MLPRRVKRCVVIQIIFSWYMSCYLWDMESQELNEWTAACLALISQEGIAKNAAIDRVCKDLAFQRSGISPMELYVSVPLTYHTTFSARLDRVWPE